MEIHKPSKKQAVLFFLFSLALAAGVVAWTFFLNQGTLVVEGDAPFRVKAAGKQWTCENSPCSMKLAPGGHTVTLEKEGFYDDTKSAIIQRWRETKLAASFQFIPTVKEVGELVLPFASAPLKTPFIGTKKFENFPKDVRDASFSDSGNFAILKLGKERYVYDTREHTVSELEIPLDAPAAWLGDKIVFLETSSKQILFVMEPGKQPGATVSFMRPLGKPTLIGAPTGNKVLIRDDDAHVFYLIDTEKLSRDRIETLGQGAAVARWTGEYFIASDSGKIVAVNGATLEKIELRASDPENIIEMQPGILIFLSSTKQDSGKSNLNQTLEEALEIAKKETVSEQPVALSFFLTELNTQNSTAKTLAEIPMQPGEEIHRLTLDSTGGKIFFTKKNKLFEILLKP